jgi:hypothetical protein
VQASEVLEGFIERYSPRIRAAESRDLENVHRSDHEAKTGNHTREVELAHSSNSNSQSEAATPSDRPATRESDDEPVSVPRTETTDGWRCWLEANVEKLLTLQRDYGAAVGALRSLNAEAASLVAGRGSKPSNPVKRFLGFVGKRRYGGALRKEVNDRQAEYEHVLQRLVDQANALTRMSRDLTGSDYSSAEFSKSLPGVLTELLKLLETVEAGQSADDALVEDFWVALMSTDSYAGHARVDWHYRAKRPVLVGAKRTLARARVLAGGLAASIRPLTRLDD